MTPDWIVEYRNSSPTLPAHWESSTNTFPGFWTIPHLVESLTLLGVVWQFAGWRIRNFRTGETIMMYQIFTLFPSVD